IQKNAHGHNRSKHLDAKPAHSASALVDLGVLFASTVIIECQTLSWLAPYLKQDYHWTNTDYANLVIGFRVAYAIGQFVWGRLMDRVGTRRGLTLSVLWYSLVSIFTPLARGFYDFAAFRCLELENPATG